MLSNAILIAWISLHQTKKHASQRSQSGGGHDWTPATPAVYGRAEAYFGSGTHYLIPRPANRFPNSWNQKISPSNQRGEEYEQSKSLHTRPRERRPHTQGR